MKILHIIGGSEQSGVYKGAYILHKALIKHKIKSKILRDCSYSENIKKDKDVICINENIFKNH